MADAEIISMGCRLNAFDAEVMRAHAHDAGVEDTVIVNTCAVTGEAVRQAQQTIRKITRERPQTRVIVTGCAAQIEPQRFAAMEGVDLVLGNEEKLKPESYGFNDFGISEEAQVKVSNIMEVRETAPHMIDGFSGRARSFVQIQTGCDHRCTFCIIPFGRGNARSVPAGAVVEQVKRLVDGGSCEVVLTGVDITSYGTDLPGPLRLGGLVQKILTMVPDLPRLRISSIDSIETDVELLDAFQSDHRIMPHLHLSVQSGDNMILKRMKRRHLREHTISFCEDVRGRRRDVVFGADIIAGFPTETEEMFENSLKLVEECGLTYLHVFPYSPRPDTPAARMPQVPKSAIKARAARLRTLGTRQLGSYLKEQCGTRLNVLMETSSAGRTDHYAAIRMDRELVPGTIVEAEVIGAGAQQLDGRFVQ